MTKVIQINSYIIGRWHQLGLEVQRPEQSTTFSFFPYLHDKRTDFKAIFFQPPYTEPAAGSVFLPMRSHWEKVYCNYILCYFVYFSYIILIKFKRTTIKYLKFLANPPDKIVRCSFFVCLFLFVFCARFNNNNNDNKNILL